MDGISTPDFRGYDEKDFVVIRSMQDITSRTDFFPEIDLVADPIKQPLGLHYLKIRCGRGGKIEGK
jgi:hypothetical protein